MIRDTPNELNKRLLLAVGRCPLHGWPESRRSKAHLATADAGPNAQVLETLRAQSSPSRDRLDADKVPFWSGTALREALSPDCRFMM
jgi:hypothetical protein